MPATKVKKKNTTKKSAVKKNVTKKRTTEKRMGMPEIKIKAKELGIIPGKMKKEELIHTIQVTEGYSACFGRSDGQCGNIDCCFIKDCLEN